MNHQLENRLKRLQLENEALKREISLLKNKSKSPLDNLMDSIPGFAFVKDIHLNYIDANNTFCDLFNIPYDQINGKNDFDIFPNDLAQKYIEDDRKVLETKKPLLVEEVTVDENNPGCRFLVATRKLPWYDENGNLAGIYGLGFDISELNHLEELRLAKEKAKEANHLKTEFIKNMSHEIRTPMNGIIGFTELLINQEISEERRNNFSQIIINSCNQLLGIIDDIIDISALETKQEQLNESDFCLNDLILGVFSTFNAKSKERNLPIYVNKALRDTESHIISDKHKIRKILNCLLENAMKFTTAGYIEIGYHIEKENLVIYVKDTGIGISSESQKVIFDRFSKEDNKIPNMHGGLGLGLSISKEMAQLLGGTITLESEKEKGSTFYLTIPYKSPIKNSEMVVEDINKT